MSIMTMAARPDTSHIDGDFRWMSLADVLALTAMDFIDRGPGRDTLADPDNQDAKREDAGYVELREDIRTDGWHTPICLICPDGCGQFALLEGHHRVVIAVDLGYEEIPVRIALDCEAILASWE